MDKINAKPPMWSFKDHWASKSQPTEKTKSAHITTSDVPTGSLPAGTLLCIGFKQV